VPLPFRQFTAVAGQATDFALLFNATFSSGFEGRYRVDLTTPAGPSTAGGKQSLQHMRLVPLDGSPAIVLGSVSPVLKSAEIRTFRHLSEIHARRFGARVPLDMNAHRDLVRRMSQFFAQQQFSVVMVDVTETPMSDRPPPMPRSSSPTAWIIAGVALALACGMAVIAVVALRSAPRPPVPAATIAPAAP
jgi:hypothetical protein